MSLEVAQAAAQAAEHASGVPFVSVFTIFVLAIFVGYYVVWGVTPARNRASSPPMTALAVPGPCANDRL